MNVTLKNVALLILVRESCSKLVSGVPLYEENNSDSYLNTPQMIRKYGYPAESHLTRTQDGYILELHRIPRGKNPNSTPRQPPILLQHGVLGSSADFVLLGPGKALSFLLADRGYDVWLGNVRGNTYSRAHEILTPADKQFWNFSWHESGMYDIAAEIDYICNYTSQEDLIYVGYSMGTTEFFVLTSERPEYQEKIRMGVLLAAVGYLNNTRTLLRYLTPLANDLQVLSELLTDGELIQQSTLYRYLVRFTCTLNRAERNLCRNILFLVTGCDPFQFNETLIPTIFNHLPAGASTKTLVHFAQLIQSVNDGNKDAIVFMASSPGKFRQFDYGAKQNVVKYGSPEPPQYEVENVNVPLHLFEGLNDFLSTKEDVSRLMKRLPNAKRTTVEYPLFNHLDFFLANDAKDLLYDKVIKAIDNAADGTLTGTDCNGECDYGYDISV